jgi:NitT/TauT family transport system substrate-binding protein
MQAIQTRRQLLSSLSAAGAVGLLGGRATLADEAPPEVTTIRLLGDASICQAPGFIADELLRAEGFTDIRYLYPSAPEWETKGHGRPRYLLSASVDNGVASGEIDFDMFPPASVMSQLDAGAPMTAVAGVHSGCYELFAHEPIRTITDLKDHSVSVRRLHSASYLQLAVMAADVGLDPRKDIDWITSANAMELFVERKVDAFIGFPPEPQELRARKIGRVILSTTTDQPWSQYLCCIVAGNREFVRNHPVATKRFLRAILKASDLCCPCAWRAASRWAMPARGATTARSAASQALVGAPATGKIASTPSPMNFSTSPPKACTAPATRSNQASRAAIMAAGSVASDRAVKSRRSA